MGLFNDILLGAFIGIIFSVFVHKLSDVLFSGTPFKEKQQKILVMLFIVAIVAIVIAQTLFTYSKTFKNRAVRLGLTFGSVLLLFHTLFTNWNTMSNDTKLLIFGISLGGLIWYGYKSSGESDEGNKKTSVKKLKNKEEVELEKFKDELEELQESQQE